jgi:hypothetical protein
VSWQLDGAALRTVAERSTATGSGPNRLPRADQPRHQATVWASRRSSSAEAGELEPEPVEDLWAEVAQAEAQPITSLDANFRH